MSMRNLASGALLALCSAAPALAPALAQSVSELQAAAEQGLAAAQTKLGAMYRDGQGVARDYRQAIAWFRKAAEQGDAEAQASLGSMYGMYMGGPDVPRDDAQAVAWYRNAAERGHAGAQTGLAGMYMRGQGVTRDFCNGPRTVNSFLRRSTRRGLASVRGRRVAAT